MRKISVVRFNNTFPESHDIKVRNELINNRNFSYLMRQIPLRVKDTTCYTDQEAFRILVHRRQELLFQLKLAELAGKFIEVLCRN
jgi:hypothetical protein